MEKDIAFKNGEDVAVYMKFLFVKRHGDFIPINRLRGGKFYSSRKNAFDRIYSEFSKRDLDIASYITYLVNVARVGDYSKNSDLLSPDMIKKYIDYRQIELKRRNIYMQFMKSAENIAKICVESGYSSSVVCLREMIKNKCLAQLFVGGVISKYYLAAISNFPFIVPKLDTFARYEFGDIVEKYDVYNTEINEAYLYFKNRRVNPFAVSDGLIESKFEELRSKNLEK